MNTGQGSGQLVIQAQWLRVSYVMRTTTAIASVALGLLSLGACGQSSGTKAASSVHASSATSSHPPSAAKLAARLKASGLPVRQLIVYTPTTDPNHEMGRQGGYTSKVAWVDPRAVKAGAGNPSSDRGGIEFGGGIEVFATVAGAQGRLEYLKSFQPPLGDGYDYLVGDAVLRLSNYLTPAQAHAYRAAFGTGQ
jgi:hypothetical protein